MAKKDYDNKAIRAYLRANPHYTLGMVADHFGVSSEVVRANKSHITMGTDTDNPQKRGEAVHTLKSFKKQLTLIKTPVYHLIIDEDGQYHRCDLKSKKIGKLTDDQAKAIMLTRLVEMTNV